VAVAVIRARLRAGHSDERSVQLRLQKAFRFKHESCGPSKMSVVAA
jgi:hypothetical protein